MESSSTVTLWINELKAGDRKAADKAFQKIWERYSARMAGFARKRFRGRSQGQGDELDILQSTFRVAYQRARDGKLDKVSDRNDLWQLLIGITAWKVRDFSRKEQRLKRGGSNSKRAYPFGDRENSSAVGLEQLAVSDASPDLPVLIAEELDRLLSLLGEEEENLRQVAEWKMEGADKREIQMKLGCSPRTVERKLRQIRTIWEQELQS